jgi:hypothetical protein
MADEPLAFSTISSLPADSDYEAICATLRKTARGRWFLEEYARRSRNGDPPTVHSPAQPPGPSIQDEHTSHAQTGLSTAVERLQDLAWTMRERGLDLVTCEQIEALASTILTARSLRDTSDGRLQQLNEVIGHLERRIQEMAESPADHRKAPRSPEVSTEPEPGDFLLELLPSAGCESAQAVAIATPAQLPLDDVAVSLDHELFAPTPPAAAASSPRTEMVPPSASDPLAALNAMSDEEKIALFT